MARVPYLEESDLDPDDRVLLSRGINLHKALVNNPQACRAFSRLASYIRNKSKLDSRLRELAILQVGYLARSRYEYSHHVKIGFEFGVAAEDIEGMVAETAGKPSNLEPRAKLVLRAAREMTLEGAVAAGTFSELEAEFGRDLIIDLVLAIAFYNGVVRVLASLEIDVEDDYQKYLEQFPLPQGEQ